MKWFIYSLILLLSLVLCSCGPSKVDPYTPKPVSFNKTEKYNANLGEIDKPDPIKPIYVKDVQGQIKEVSKENATMALLPQKEYKKISALLDVAKGYKKVALQQEDLINLRIRQLNSLKEFVKLEQEKSKRYREMWINSENKYRNERWEHKKDNMINKAGMYILSIGSIISVIAVGL